MKKVVHAGYRVIELEPENLSEKIKQGIIRTGLKAFGPGMTEEEILEHIMPTDRIYIGFDGSDVMGFATANIGDAVVDFVGSAVNPDYQGNGLYGEFVMRRVSLAFEHKKDHVALRTQNPVIYHGVKKSLDNLREIGIIDRYTVSKEHVKGLYGRMLTSERPYSGIEKIDSMFDVLDYKAGDTFALQFGLVR